MHGWMQVKLRQCVRATAADTAWKTPVLCWPLGNNFVFWARAKENIGLQERKTQPKGLEQRGDFLLPLAQALLQPDLQGRDRCEAY